MHKTLSVRRFADPNSRVGRGVSTSMHRRSFIQSLMAIPVATASLTAATGIDAVSKSNPDLGPSRVLPRGLFPGCTVGIACPASSATQSDVKDFVSLCASWGMKVKLGSNISRRSGYLSAPDKARTDEFMGLINDPEVDAVVCARGGYGVMRILPMLDYAAIRQARKMVMGFSDITALLIAIQQQSGLVTFHGPVASSTFDPFTVGSLRDVTSTQEPSLPLPFSDQRLTTIRPGLCRGRITGGNLSMIVSTLGSKYEIDTTGAILFLEEIHEEPYRIDRMLTQLWLAGKLQACSGIALGNFRDCESKGKSITGPSFTLEQVFKQRIASLGIPAVYGLPVGHVKSKLTVPIGINAELDATNKQLRLLESAVNMETPRT